MMFDAKHIVAADLVIAEEIAQYLDDGQPKPKLGASLRRGLTRLMGRGEQAQPEMETANVPAGQEALKNWV